MNRRNIIRVELSDVAMEKLRQMQEFYGFSPAVFVKQALLEKYQQMQYMPGFRAQKPEKPVRDVGRPPDPVEAGKAKRQYRELVEVYAKLRDSYVNHPTETVAQFEALYGQQLQDLEQAYARKDWSWIIAFNNAAPWGPSSKPYSTAGITNLARGESNTESEQAG